MNKRQVKKNTKAQKIEKLEKENWFLKNRCFAQTHGTVCSFCSMECEKRTKEFWLNGKDK